MFENIKVMRVPEIFNFEQNEMWMGYINPYAQYEKPCNYCDNNGYSEAYRILRNIWYGVIEDEFGKTLDRARDLDERLYQFAKRQNDLNSSSPIIKKINGKNHRLMGWQYRIDQSDIDKAVAAKALHYPFSEKSAVGADEYNQFSINNPMGCLQEYLFIGIKCHEFGFSLECEHCHGEGFIIDPEYKEAYSNWKRTDPPYGTSYQLWDINGLALSPVISEKMVMAGYIMAKIGISYEDALILINK